MSEYPPDRVFIRLEIYRGNEPRVYKINETFGMEDAAGIAINLENIKQQSLAEFTERDYRKRRQPTEGKEKQ